MHPFFTELGQDILGRWKSNNFSPQDFPNLAADALARRPPSEHVELAELASRFLLDDEQPLQTLSGFGEPELVVYDHPRFYIQVLFWLDGSTDIHQHGFSGAFHVYEGSSIHADYVFQDARSISAHLRAGSLRMKGIRLLERGSIERIFSGASYIHSLFHLDVPSVTAVVRTHHDPGSDPQFTYLPPHIAVDPLLDDSLTTRRKQLLDVMERLEDPAYPALVRRMLGELDFERGFFILQNCMGRLRSLDEWEETLGLFQSRHPALAEYVAPTLEEIVRRDALVHMRKSVTEPEHRFFLALLLNAPSRADILEMVAQRFAGAHPGETVLRWLEELMEISEVSTWILDAEFPPELGVAVERQPAMFLSAIQCFLADGKTHEASKLKPRQISAIRGALMRSSLRALVPAQPL